MKKNILFLIIVILIFIGFLIYGWARGKDQGQGDLIKEPQDKNEQLSSRNGKDLTEARKQAMEYVVQNISQLSPVEPVLGGSWHINRFWWPKKQQGQVKDFYAEYEDGHILRQIIVRHSLKDSQSQYKLIAYFEPGEEAWELKQGDNTLFGQELELYEFNSGIGEWETD